MKQTILKYISLLAFLGSPFFSSQTFAAECATGTAPLAGCTIDVSDITYTLTGDIEPAATVIGIEIGGLTAVSASTLNLTGDITTSGANADGIKENADSQLNTINITGDISASGFSADGINTNALGYSFITLLGDITVSGTSGHGVKLYTDNSEFTMTGNIATSGQGGDGLDIQSDSTTVLLTGDITLLEENAIGPQDAITVFGDSNNVTITGNVTSNASTGPRGSYGTGLYVNGTSNTIVLNGNMTMTGNGPGEAIELNTSNSNTITMTGNISTVGDTAHGIGLDTSDSNTLNITGDITTTGDGSRGIYSKDSDSNIYTVIGDISTTGDNARGIFIKTSDSNTINMTGNITTTGDGAYGMRLNGSNSNDIMITGNITTSGTDGDSEAILINNSDSNTITLSGSIQSLGGDQAIYINAGSDANTFGIESGATFLGEFENLGTNTVITNRGVMDGIENTGSIATFNNAQTGATYSGTLPVNYNIIINSSTSYGQMFVTSEAGSTNFGVSSAPDNLTIGKYANVMTGISDGNVGATRSGSLDGNGTSSAGTANWVLTETASGSSAWDLNITGDYVYFASVATLQSSVNNTASAMRGAFNSMTSSMNFANMTTYDCNLFGNNNGCVSVGGRYTGTDNPDTTATAVVAKAGYKFNEHFRYGAFVDQTANSKTGNVDMDMNTPMVGLMGVWNHNPDQLGMQVKLANTYQSTDASITRNDGLSTNYTGDTDINAQSYVAELSWRHLNNQKDTLLQPFVATRYAIIDQDGYSDGFVNYGSVEQKTFTALAGVKAFYQYSHKMTYMGSLGIEHDLDEDTDDLSVSVSGVSGLTAASMTDGGEDKTRILGSVGARFFVTPNQRLEGKLMYEQLRYNNADNTT
ncbi:hypothetical protein N9542_04080, partial [Methylophilaceae bacterium]|nr:hypothetical protein [Methylophilaceae bacterium]